MAVESGQFYTENLGFQDWSSFHPFDNLCFEIPHDQTQQQQLHSHGVSSSSSSVTFSPMAVAYSLNSELELQRRETDLILQLHSQKLRLLLHEQRQQQLTALLGNLETEASNMMKLKEEDLAQAKKKTTELQQQLNKAEMEKEAWKRAATAKEAVVRGLHGRLEEARERQAVAGAGADAESWCDSPEKENLARKNGGMCRRCRKRSRSVVFLPCRHLGSCKDCEAVLGRCPVCECVKEASMEVVLV